MDEFLCLTILAQRGESQAEFKSRLTAFWTHILRTLPDDYEKVYSEAKEFESEKGRMCRQYMVEPGVADVLAANLKEHSFEYVQWDQYDYYTKAEASSSDWFQIPHD